MANYKIYKNIRLVGTKGDDGDAAESDITAPIGAIFALDSDTVPTGYQETTPPEPPTPEPDYLYKWDFRNSMIDEIEGAEIELFNGATRDSNGINISGNRQAAKWLDGIDLRGKTLEIEMGAVDFKPANSQLTSNDIGFIATPKKVNTSSSSPWTRYASPLYYRRSTGFGCYGAANYDNITQATSLNWSMYTETGNLTGNTKNVFNYFSNKNIKIITSDDGGTTSIYFDDILEGIATNNYAVNSDNILTFNDASLNPNYSNSEAKFYDMIIKTLGIYENE